MTEYVLSANARVFAWISQNVVAWQQGTGEAETLRRMVPGDYIVPKFAQQAAYGDDDVAAQRAVCEALGLTFEDVVGNYEDIIDGGRGAVPFVMRVTGSSQEDDSKSEPVVRVDVKIEELERPLSTQVFLRLRSLPHEVAAQFKGTVGRGRHIQEVPRGLLASVRAAGSADDIEELLRRYSLVEAQTVEAAAELLRDAGRPPREGDEAFLATRAVMPGVARVTADEELVLEHEPIAQAPDSVKALLEDAQRRASPKDPFTPGPALIAADELLGLLNGDAKVLPVDDFARFYDRYRLLTKKVTQALALSKKPLPSDVRRGGDEDSESQTPEDLENPDVSTALAGLSVEAIEATLPEGFSIDRQVIAAAVTALRAGKHLLLGGPPGTGKTTLGEALCRAVVAQNYRVTTATADWTTFDTIGGYLPTDKGLQFSPGVVLRAIRDGSWLLIDEVNRADIDKAFGPLFTVLSGGDGATGRQSVLPYADGGKTVSVEWVSSTAKSNATYALTPSWRLIGTLNVSDKASLFRLSFAFLRRFAVIDVPLPKPDEYRKLFEAWFQAAAYEMRSKLVEASLSIAHGPVPIGPAISRDVALFVLEATSPTASGSSSFDSADEALLTAVRLLVVPQYEGAPPSDGEALTAIVDEVLPNVSAEARGLLITALGEVALS